MRGVAFVVPGPIGTKTGGFRYDLKMVEGLRRLGWTVDVRELTGRFPDPTLETEAQAADVLGSLPDHSTVIMDGLALSSMPDLVEHERSRLRVVALVHLPLSADVSREPAAAARVAALEGRALRASALVVVTGTAAIAMLREYLPLARLVVIEPGTDRAPLARGSDGATVQLLTVATLQPGKGHDVLLRALASVSGRRWHLTCAGSLTWQPRTAAHVRDAIARLGLAERVSLVGELDNEALATRYDGADVCVTATLQETYGMSVAEALSHGLPVVGTLTGALPDLVGDRAGILVPPGDVDAMTDALQRVINDDQLRARLALGAREARAHLPGWDEAAARLAAALEEVHARG